MYLESLCLYSANVMKKDEEILKETDDYIFYIICSRTTLRSDVSSLWIHIE